MSSPGKKFQIIGFLAICSCGKPVDGAAAKPQSVTSVSTQNLYSAVFGQTLGQRQTAAAAVAALPIAEYYRNILADATNDPLVIDGYEIKNIRTLLLSRRAFYEELGARFATIGDLWQATAYDPAATLSESIFSSQLDQSLGTFKLHGLSLTDDGSAEGSSVSGSPNGSASSPGTSADTPSDPGSTEESDCPTPPVEIVQQPESALVRKVNAALAAAYEGDADCAPGQIKMATQDKPYRCYTKYKSSGGSAETYKCVSGTYPCSKTSMEVYRGPTLKFCTNTRDRS